MNNNYLASNDYLDFIKSIKISIQQASHIAIRKVNSELINLYFTIGKQIVLKQNAASWGDDLIGQIEIDLKKFFPDLRGFSRTNLFYMRNFYLFFNTSKLVPQAVGQLPWGHIRLILDKIENLDEATFYIQKTIENSWSRVILDHQISLNLFKRQGRLVSNFDKTITNNEIDLIKESFKENYILDFLGLGQNIKEAKLENLLIQNITSLILELGKGFAFIGKQYKLIVGGQEFFIDLLFYNYILKRFVIIELKTTEFKPDYIGQIGFYITAVDRDVKNIEDKSTIGLVICKNKNSTVVEYTLTTIKNPVGVAEYKLSEIPSDIAKYLPSEDEIKRIL